MSAQLLGDGLNLACRNALYVHLHHGHYQRFLTSLVTLEHLGAEPSLAVLRDAQFDLVHPSNKSPVVISRAVAEPARRALSFAGLQRLLHFCFQHLLLRSAPLMPSADPDLPAATASVLLSSLACVRYPFFGHLSFPLLRRERNVKGLE